LNFEINSLQDIRQTPEYARFMEMLGWQLEGIGPTYAFVKKLPLLPFSIIKILRYHPPLSSIKLEKLAKKHHAIIVKEEPFILDQKYTSFCHPDPPVGGEGSSPAEGVGVTGIRQRFFGSKSRPLRMTECKLCLERQINNPIYFQVSPNNQWPLLPTKTIWTDLSQSEKNLLGRLKPKARYNLKKAVENKLTVAIIPGNKINHGQLKEFYNLWSHNKPHNFLFKPHFTELKSLVACFGKKCFFVFIYLPCHSNPPLRRGKNLAKRNLYAPIKIGARSFSANWRIRMTENGVAACCLILISSNMVFYWHNASTKSGKKLFAPTLCVWEAIKEAKRRKLKVFDFEGVWDERFPDLNKGWKGFSRFKEGFTK